MKERIRIKSTVYGKQRAIDRSVEEKDEGRKAVFIVD